MLAKTIHAVRQLQTTQRTIPLCLCHGKLEWELLLLRDLVLSLSVLLKDTFQEFDIVVLVQCKKQFFGFYRLLLLFDSALALDSLLECCVDSEGNSKGILLRLDWLDWYASTQNWKWCVSYYATQLHLRSFPGCLQGVTFWILIPWRYKNNCNWQLLTVINLGHVILKSCDSHFGERANFSKSLRIELSEHPTCLNSPHIWHNLNKVWALPQSCQQSQVSLVTTSTIPPSCCPLLLCHYTNSPPLSSFSATWT